MAKANNIEVQKGPIIPDQPNYKYIRPEEQVREDANMRSERAAGVRITLHEPKK